MFQKERKKFEMVQGYVFDIFLSNPFDFFYLCCLLGITQQSKMERNRREKQKERKNCDFYVTKVKERERV
jgi:hypothetical protein